VVPAHVQGKLIDFATADDTTFDMNQGRRVFKPEEQLTTDGAEADEDDPSTLKVQNLPQSQRAYAEQLIPFYGEMVPCMMYSTKWKMREQGVQDFTQGMQKAMAQAVQSDPSNQEQPQPEAINLDQKCNQALILNMNEVLNDKVQQIVKKTVDMVESYQAVLEAYKQVNPKQDTSNFEKFLMNFLEKLADPKSSTRVQKAYMRFFSVQQLDCVYLLQFIFKPQSFSSQTSQASVKHRVPRLRILLSFLTDFQSYESKGRITKDTFPLYNPILPVL